VDVLLKPELQRFVDQQVKSGRFASMAEVLEAGVARLMVDSDPAKLDAGELAEIRESLAQMRRGEVVDWREHSAQFRTQ
jgi:Arc/MetJ-type ribon-helix-helix transcriptional regulator